MRSAQSAPGSGPGLGDSGLDFRGRDLSWGEDAGLWFAVRGMRCEVCEWDGGR